MKRYFTHPHPSTFYTHLAQRVSYLRCFATKGQFWLETAFHRTALHTRGLILIPHLHPPPAQPYSNPVSRHELTGAKEVAKWWKVSHLCLRILRLI